MTRDDIIRMALEAGFGCDTDGRHLFTDNRDGICDEYLERFAALVAAAEREACAKFCESNQVFRGPKGSVGFYPFYKEHGGRHEGMEYAAAIRARGEVKP